MDAKERFKQAFATAKDALSRQPIADEAAAAAKRERWVQTVTPVAEFAEWLKTQEIKENQQEFGFGGDGLEYSDCWRYAPYVYHLSLNKEGNVTDRYTVRILRITVTPGNEAPFCWSSLDKDGNSVVDTHCYTDLNAFLNEVVEYAAQAFARVQHDRLGRLRNT